MSRIENRLYLKILFCRKNVDSRRTRCNLSDIADGIPITNAITDKIKVAFVLVTLSSSTAQATPTSRSDIEDVNAAIARRIKKKIPTIVPPGILCEIGSLMHRSFYYIADSPASND